MRAFVSPTDQSAASSSSSRNTGSGEIIRINHQTYKSNVYRLGSSATNVDQLDEEEDCPAKLDKNMKRMVTRQKK